MNVLHTFRTMALVGLALAAAACTRQMDPDSPKAVAPSAALRGGSASMKAAEVRTVGERRDAFIGDTFADVQKALGSKSQDPDAPSF